MYSFGSGVLFGRRTDIANATPVNFGLIQTCSIDETATIKELYGQFQHPVAIARGTTKTTLKATAARISGLALGNLFYGVTPVAGQVATAFAEAAVIPATTPFVVTAANGLTWVADLGVVNALTGLPFTKVAASPSAGQYSVATGGVYTFAAADTGKPILLNYTYTMSSGGQQIVVTNQLLGSTPTFGAQFYTVFGGQAVSLMINNLTCSKYSFATKLEDFVIPDFEAEAYSDAAGNVLTWSFSEAS